MVPFVICGRPHHYSWITQRQGPCEAFQVPATAFVYGVRLPVALVTPAVVLGWNPFVLPSSCFHHTPWNVLNEAGRYVSCNKVRLSS